MAVTTLPTATLGQVVCYRASTFTFPLWGAISNNALARFNRPGFYAQYLSLHPLGPLSEMLRTFERLQSSSVAPYRATESDVGRQRHRLWALRLDAGDVFELDYRNCSLVGLQPDDLVDDDQTACQLAGERFGRHPLLPTMWSYPSAALPGTRNLVIFGPRFLQPYDSAAVGRGIPGSAIGDDAHAVKETLALMRHFGDKHPGLEDFLVGNAPAPLLQPVFFGI